MATFYELSDHGLISFTGADAAAFLHSQLTSDVVGLDVPHTQYSGYCTPKGRLLATFILWRMAEEILLELPATLREAVQTRLAKYVLRAKVKVADASSAYAIFGIAGSDAAERVAALCGSVPSEDHALVLRHQNAVVQPNQPEHQIEVAATRLPLNRYAVLVRSDRAPQMRAEFAKTADVEAWRALDIEAGVPIITPETQEQFVPQMVNLDRIGGVSLTKGCYPGQEIVARTHYLGRLKQRMYRVRVPAGISPRVGDRLFSAEYGAEQASGTLLNCAAAASGTHEALAVVYTSSLARGLHWGALDGPVVDLLPLPYPLD